MNLRSILLAAAALTVATPASAAQPDYAAAVSADYKSSLGALFDHFHRNPELSFKETATAARMAKELRAVPGMAVTEKVGGTGVVGVLKNGAGPTILVRADMDGLPVEEASGLAYASKAKQVDIDGIEKPVMHACGHDTHITGLVGTARRLAALKDRWRGTILFVVQPAEERVGGAKAMLADGLYTRFGKPNYALAWHVNSGLGSGKVSASESIQYASADSVDITVQGVGAHGASPHTGKDPIYIASQIVTALQGMVAREIDPIKPALITVGAFHAGFKHNIISDKAELQLTVRANDEDTRQYLLKAIPRLARSIALANALPEDKLPIVKNPEGTPVTVNDTALARRLNAVMASTLGAGKVQPFVQQGMGGEDFAYFITRDLGVPGYYFLVGGTPQAALDAAAKGGPPVPSHHSPLFKIAPEEAIVTGTIAMTAAVLDLMKPTATAQR
jgi:hippurate hydrolase